MANNNNVNYLQVLDLAGVQQLWNTCKQTFVQTVNGQGIDANGNVQISGFNVLDAYPVGSIYMSVNNTSPALLFGGTWQQINGLTKLWENETPTNSFSSQQITLSQAITNFKYFIVEVALLNSSGQGNMLFKFRALTSQNNYLTVFDNGSSATHSTRAFTTISATKIQISNCSNGNGNCIPLAIYGTSFLDTDEIQYIWKRTA